MAVYAVPCANAACAGCHATVPVYWSVAVMAVTGVAPTAGAVSPPMAAMLIFASCAGGSGLSGLSSPQENRATVTIANILNPHCRQSPSSENIFVRDQRVTNVANFFLPVFVFQHADNKDFHFW